jgi:iron complex outermembrane recepter protein
MIPKLFSYLLLLLLPAIVFAQTRVITGHVRDETGKALSGASVVAIPSGKGTVTRGNGEFVLTVGEKDRVISVSSLNYETDSTLLGASTEYEIRLRPASTNLAEVVLVGTRSQGRSRLNTPVPVDIFSMPALQLRAPQNDLNQMLQFASPSFNSNRQSSSDGTEHIDPASIRGLGPDQLLVLINGKRRHTTSLVNNQGTVGNGSVGTDLNAIPASAIDRIEILRDGASAQYGSDAIAGVVNIILKKNTGKLFASATGGQSSHGDGGLGQLNLNYGTGLGSHGGFLNLTGEGYYRDRTTRTQDPNLIIFDQTSIGNPNNGGYTLAYDYAGDPVASRTFDDNKLKQAGLKRSDFNFQIGDARIINTSVFFNMALPFTNGKGEFYVFGGYSFRHGEGYGFRRLPSDSSVNVYSIYPNGYQPNTTSHIQDRSLAVGVKRKLGEWNADLSNTLGDNRFDFLVNHTVNASLGAQSPTSFKAGGHEFLQNTTNLDFSRYYSTIASGLNLAFGGEFRLDDYRIRTGEEASWKNYGLTEDAFGNVTDTLVVYNPDGPVGIGGGSQSFPGFSPVNAIHKSRTNSSVYADAELDVTKSWLLSGAARFEHYSDFGSALNGKFATRYKIADGYVIRGAVSTGFRAPSLHQQYFSYVSTDILPNGKLGQSGFFANNSPVAAALGIPKLKEETSVNYSLGFTAQPARDLDISVDGYLINIKNRIVLTGDFGYAADGSGTPDSVIQSIINPYGASDARFFSNAVNTRTLGLDVVANYHYRSGQHRFTASLGLNVNKSSITGPLHIPDALKGRDRIFFSPNDSVLIVEGTPRVKGTLAFTYEYKQFSVLLREVYFGQVERNDFPYGTVQKHSPKGVTDLSFSYALRKVTLTVGANNLFDVFPDKQVYGNSYFGVFKYANVQMGTLGAFYFARLTMDLPTSRG